MAESRISTDIYDDWNAVENRAQAEQLIKEKLKPEDSYLQTLVDTNTSKRPALVMEYMLNWEVGTYEDRCIALLKIIKTYDTTHEEHYADPETQKPIELLISAVDVHQLKKEWDAFQSDQNHTNEFSAKLNEKLNNLKEEDWEKVKTFIPKAASESEIETLLNEKITDASSSRLVLSYLIAQDLKQELPSVNASSAVISSPIHVSPSFSQAEQKKPLKVLPALQVIMTDNGPSYLSTPIIKDAKYTLKHVSSTIDGPLHPIPLQFNSLTQCLKYIAYCVKPHMVERELVTSLGGRATTYADVSSYATQAHTLANDNQNLIGANEIKLLMEIAVNESIIHIEMGGFQRVFASLCQALCYTIQHISHLFASPAYQSISWQYGKRDVNEIIFSKNKMKLLDLVFSLIDTNSTAIIQSSMNSFNSFKQTLSKAASFRCETESAPLLKMARLHPEGQETALKLAKRLGTLLYNIGASLRTQENHKESLMTFFVSLRYLEFYSSLANQPETADFVRDTLLELKDLTSGPLVLFAGKSLKELYFPLLSSLSKQFLQDAEQFEMNTWMKACARTHAISTALMFQPRQQQPDEQKKFPRTLTTPRAVL